MSTSSSVLLVSVIIAFANEASQTVSSEENELEHFKNSARKSYQHQGCYKLGNGKTGSLLKRSHSSVKKCAWIARSRGFPQFALLKGGECRGGNNLHDAYMAYGTSVNCRNGQGAQGAADLYSIVKAECRIESSDKANRECLGQRQGETSRAGLFYELGPPTINFPLPSLNKNPTVVYGMLKQDPLDSKWIDLYTKGTIEKNLNISRLFLAVTNGTEFETEGDYVKAYNFFLSHQRSLISNPDDRKHFRFHFEDPSIPFRNISDLAQWRDDEVFTDQRLAGANPMSIQRASWNPERTGGVDWAQVSQTLNPSFDWEQAVNDVMGSDISLAQAVSQGFVYVVQYPLYKGLPTIAGDPFGKLMDAFSPIAIFVSKPRRKQLNRLKPVAIQLNCSSESPVFTPDDGERWLMAKHVLQVADFAHFQIVEHLYKIHLFMEPPCVCVHRHLSKLHPVHQLLKHHCRGLLGTNTFGYPFLMAPGNGSLNKLLAVGRAGAIEMISRAHKVADWYDTDFPMNIKKRGLGDKDKLPYFPYRDDGELIHAAISNMVNEYVDKYYNSHKEVTCDSELQKFAQYCSSGTGRVKKFPAKISSKWILKKLLTRFIWVTSAQHSAVNYGSSFIAALTPNMPSKLYNDCRVRPGHYGVYNLPRRATSGVQAAVCMALGSMHYDSLFDYAESLPDKKGSIVVEKYYNYLQNTVKSTIEQRNLQRVDEGYLPYPHLVPKWIANSIHT